MHAEIRQALTEWWCGRLDNAEFKARLDQLLVPSAVQVSGRDAILEECALQCDKAAERIIEKRGRSEGAAYCADLIRALKGKPASTVEAPEVDLMKALKEKLPQGVPVAWRYRYGPKGTWKYADSAADVNPSPQYEQQPLYTAPSPASSIEACSDEPPVIFSAGTWTWSGDGRAYDSRELDAAAWHKLKKPVSAIQRTEEKA